MPKMADSEKDAILEMYHTGNYEEFSCLTVVFNVMIKMKIVGKQLLEQITKHRKTSEDQETDDDVGMTERKRVTNQDARTVTLCI
jgi:hypothetical protein